METKLQAFEKSQLRKDLPDVRPGDFIRIYQQIEEKGKKRTQLFEGVVIARKHGKGITSTITVRKVISDIGVEKIFPIHSPTIEKIEILRRGKTRRAKLYYLRKAKGRKAKLKKKEFIEEIAQAPEEESAPELEKEETIKEEREEEKAEKEEKDVKAEKEESKAGTDEKKEPEKLEKKEEEPKNQTEKKSEKEEKN